MVRQRIGIMSIKLLVINDPHVAHTPPLGRTSDYEDQIMAKLEECSAIAQAQECDAVLLSGDLFHKWRGTVPYSLTNRLKDWIRNVSCPIIAVPGNHDMTYGGIHELDKMPFGSFAFDIEIINRNNPAFIGETVAVGTPVHDVLIIGREWEPYIDTQKTAFKLTDKEKTLAKNRYTIMLTHASILPPGQVRPYPYHDVSKMGLDEDIDMILSGHIHENLGVHDVDGLWFANVGSVGRVSRTKENLEGHIPSVLLVTISNDDDVAPDFEVIELESALPAEDVFFEKAPTVEKELREFSEALVDGIEMETMPLDELITKYADGESEQVVVRLREYLSGVAD